ncbi:MAG: ABC transporter ATP-binding protein [Candidatus Altiarchaeota archaeon]
MPNIEVRGLSKSFGKTKAVREASFRVEDGEYVVVLGPSGCGKTTLLKTIAGLYAPDEGSVLIDGADVTSVPVEKRGIGFFFQQYSLFPHLSVRGNIGYSLEIRGMDGGQVRRIVDDKLKLVGLADWADHMPHQLSGGMQQRVGLARALATGSKILLLDEPLNALDAKIASILRRELKAMASRLGLTVIHVSPNQAEAMEVADRLILINKGRIIQEGIPADVYLNPKNPFSAYFLGESNFIKVGRVSPNVVKYRHALFNVAGVIPEDEMILAIRPEKIRFEHHDRNCLEGIIESVNFLGHTTRYEVTRKGRFFQVQTSKHPHLKKGDRIHLMFPAEDVMMFMTNQPIDDEITVN